MINAPLSRRSVLLSTAAALLSLVARALGAEQELITVHKDPTCGCCTGWVRHLQKNGFTTKVIETAQIDAVKKRLGVPDNLATCHTAEVAGYILEGHVPATAVRRLLTERPAAMGLAVAGMPVGAPGMEGGAPEAYDVVLFAPQG